MSVQAQSRGPSGERANAQTLPESFVVLELDPIERGTLPLGRILSIQQLPGDQMRTEPMPPHSSARREHEEARHDAPFGKEEGTFAKMAKDPCLHGSEPTGIAPHSRNRRRSK